MVPRRSSWLARNPIVAGRTLPHEWDAGQPWQETFSMYLGAKEGYREGLTEELRGLDREAGRH